MIPLYPIISHYIIIDYGPFIIYITSGLIVGLLIFLDTSGILGRVNIVGHGVLSPHTHPHRDKQRHTDNTDTHRHR